MRKKYNVLKRQSHSDKIVLTLCEYPMGEEIAFECHSLEEYYLNLVKMKDILIKVKGIPYSQVSRAIGTLVEVSRLSKEDGIHLIKVEKD